MGLDGRLRVGRREQSAGAMSAKGSDYSALLRPLLADLETAALLRT